MDNIVPFNKQKRKTDAHYRRTPYVAHFDMDGLMLKAAKVSVGVSGTAFVLYFIFQAFG